jgi:hypothetical protein
MLSLTIINENHEGLLAEITALLAENNILLRDFSGEVIGDTAVIKFIPDPYHRCFKLLTDSGYQVIASQSLLLRLKQGPGELARLSRELAECNIEIRSMHIVNRSETGALVALEVDAPRQARKHLKEILV